MAQRSGTAGDGTGPPQGCRTRSRFASRSSSTAVCSQTMSALVDRSVHSDTLSTNYRARPRHTWPCTDEDESQYALA